MEEGHESMLQLYKFVDSNAEVKEPIDEFVLPKESERRRGYLATRFDQIWMDQLNLHEEHWMLPNSSAH